MIRELKGEQTNKYTDTLVENLSSDIKTNYYLFQNIDAPCPYFKTVIKKAHVKPLYAKSHTMLDVFWPAYT